MPECFSTPTREVWFDSLENVVAWISTIDTPEAEAAVAFLEHHIFLHVDRDVVTTKITEIEHEYSTDLNMDYDQVTNLCLLIQDIMYHDRHLLKKFVDDIIADNILQHSSYFRAFRSELPVDLGELSTRKNRSKLKHLFRLYAHWLSDIDINTDKQELVEYWRTGETDYLRKMTTNKERISQTMKTLNALRTIKTL